MEKRIRINFLGFKIVFKNPFAIQNNKIFLIKNGKAKRLFFVRGLKVNYYGANNRIEFYDKVPKMQNVRICFGENCRVKIRDSKYVIKNLDINARAENVSVNIGKDFSIESGEFDFHGEPNLNINIGNDCQFGCNIRLDTADGHTIYNNVNKVILNRPNDINIGDHVWLCRNVSVLKGASIPNNCVVGLGSIVTRAFDKTNKLIVGTPARMIESEQYSNIDWTRSPNRAFFECNTIPIVLHCDLDFWATIFYWLNYLSSPFLSLFLR